MTDENNTTTDALNHDTTNKVYPYDLVEVLRKKSYSKGFKKGYDKGYNACLAELIAYVSNAKPKMTVKKPENHISTSETHENSINDEL